MTKTYCDACGKEVEVASHLNINGKTYDFCPECYRCVTLNQNYLSNILALGFHLKKGTEIPIIKERK